MTARATLLQLAARVEAAEGADTILVAAVDAYDVARCAAHGMHIDVAGMSTKNRQSIAPMIGAAIAAALRALAEVAGDE